MWTHDYDIRLKFVLQLGVCVRITQRDPAFQNAFISLTFSSIAVILCTIRFNNKKAARVAEAESSVFKFAIQNCKD